VRTKRATGHRNDDDDDDDDQHEVHVRAALSKLPA
jgi:hypothetical protein